MILLLVTWFICGILCAILMLRELSDSPTFSWSDLFMLIIIVIAGYVAALILGGILAMIWLDEHDIPDKIKDHKFRNPFYKGKS